MALAPGSRGSRSTQQCFPNRIVNGSVVRFAETVPHWSDRSPEPRQPRSDFVGPRVDENQPRLCAAVALEDSSNDPVTEGVAYCDPPRSLSQLAIEHEIHRLVGLHIELLLLNRVQHTGAPELPTSKGLHLFRGYPLFGQAPAVIEEPGY